VELKAPTPPARATWRGLKRGERQRGRSRQKAVCLSSKIALGVKGQPDFGPVGLPAGSGNRTGFPPPPAGQGRAREKRGLIQVEAKLMAKEQRQVPPQAGPPPPSGTDPGSRVGRLSGFFSS